MPKTWSNFRRAGVANWMIVRQNGDSEGCLLFDPGNSAHVKLAIKIARVKVRRISTPEELARLRNTAFQPALE